jgi:hypothetical protein
MTVDRQCPVERRHLEMMVAQIHNSVSRTMDELLKGGGPLPDDDLWVVKEAVATARAIQAEVAATEQGADNSELSAVCPVPPFPGIRGGGTDD